ncbi:hypothetical protein K402DRAFT_26544 [Aulographum hederae CBS 113979]|uniref:Uncharacterized protein n=1 Tax=Aulographum hederae CBS 113979 TaxID=1176131 RepID=A0A6G1H6B5_9PEZI|nr:hypothetical protein K402DRAFT_26544 [Aulographum hederae CBS 113979]
MTACYPPPNINSRQCRLCDFPVAAFSLHEFPRNSHAQFVLFLACKDAIYHFWFSALRSSERLVKVVDFVYRPPGPTTLVGYHCRVRSTFMGKIKEGAHFFRSCKLERCTFTRSSPFLRELVFFHMHALSSFRSRSSITFPAFSLLAFIFPPFLSTWALLVVEKTQRYL